MQPNVRVCLQLQVKRQLRPDRGKLHNVIPARVCQQLELPVRVSNKGDATFLEVPTEIAAPLLAGKFTGS